MKKIILITLVALLILSISTNIYLFISQKPNNSDIAEKDNLDDWIGHYFFSEYEEPNIATSHNVSIVKDNNNNYYAEFRVDGYMKLERIIAKVQGNENRIELIFDYYLPESFVYTYTKYENKDLLLAFEKREEEIYTFWEKYQPVSPSNIESNNIYFEKTFNMWRTTANPIDNFFTKVYSEIGGSTYANNIIGSLCVQAWKEEMYNAYDKLYEKAHPDIKQQVLDLMKSNNDFAEKSNILGLYGWSTAFGWDKELESEGKYHYDFPISYGSGSGASSLYSSRIVYRENTLRLLEILCDADYSTGEGYIYIFDESKYMLELEEFYANN